MSVVSVEHEEDNVTLRHSEKCYSLILYVSIQAVVVRA